MTLERTEDAALRGILHLTIGGERVTLRTLTLDESDAWLDRYNAAINGVELSPEGQNVFTAGAAAMRELVAAYDLDGALPEDWSRRMSKRELKANLEAMVEAEDPFGEGVAHSVAEAFGAPVRMLRQGFAALFDERTLSLLATLTSGSDANGASATPRSGGRGRSSRSTSAGATRKSRKRAG